MHRFKQRFRGPWSGGGRLFGPGEVRFAILSLLAESPAHGYQLMSRLEERTGGAYQPSAGTIYPTLQQLEDEGLVRAAESEGKKVYSLTAAGKQEVERRRDEIAEIWRRTKDWSEWGEMRNPDVAEIIGPAMRLAKSAFRAVARSRGDPAVVDAIRDILDEAREQVERAPRRSKR